MKENRRNADKIKQEINLNIKNNKKLVNDRNALLKSISNKAAPTILDIVVTKISGLVNNIPPKIKNMMELIKED